MTRCSRCGSRLGPVELSANNGHCPYCHPPQLVLTRERTVEEWDEVLDGGCPDCHIPWECKVGVFFCACGNIPPTAIRIGVEFDLSFLH